MTIGKTSPPQSAPRTAAEIAEAAALFLGPFPVSELSWKFEGSQHLVDEAQLLSHLRLLGLQVGLVINFHVVLLRDGVRRMVNDYREDEPTAECAENCRRDR